MQRRPNLLDSVKVPIPANLFHGESALRQYLVLLYILLKSTHPITIDFDRLFTEAALNEPLKSIEFFAALELRWLQLRLTYWFYKQSCLGERSQGTRRAQE
jgi:hypothetical protein